jgi:hypothetical protein
MALVSPIFGLGVYLKLHTVGFQGFGGRNHILTPERQRRKIADAILMTLRGEKRKPGFRTWNEKFRSSFVPSEKTGR